MYAQISPTAAFAPRPWRAQQIPLPLMMVRGVPVRGLGLTFREKLVTGITGGVAAGATTAALTGSTSAGVLSGGLMAAVPFVGAIPFAGPLLMAASAMAKPITDLFTGCGEPCRQAARIANALQFASDHVLAAYQAEPVRYRSTQQDALAVLDQLVTEAKLAFSDPLLGDVGRQYMEERFVRGGPAPWCPTPDHTGCDYFTTYRDPIANDPTVVDDPRMAGAIAGPEGVNLGLVLPLAAIAAGILM